MKHIHRIYALLMAALLALSMCVTAFAAPIIDSAKKTSLTIYKYDMTKATADNAWDGSYVSTGTLDQSVVDTLAPYAIRGVEFTYLKVADFTTYHQDNGAGEYTVMPLYGFTDGAATTALLTALGLSAEDAHHTTGTVSYYTSDTILSGLSDSLTNNTIATKNTLESYVRLNGGVAMTETDETGKTSAADLAQGLYLVAETRVPQQVTATVNPFLVSLPMTTVDGSEWNYDVTVYPKNQTGKPTLDKGVREAAADTGKSDAYAPTATGSAGDTMEYQLLSKLPSITSAATHLTRYTFLDRMDKGLTYHKDDVVIEFYKDAACTDKITTWDEASGKFTVTYDAAANNMTIEMTEAGLAELNTATTVYNDASQCRGYSDCVMRITYACTVNADASFVLGSEGNDNTVLLTWKRTNDTYYDTLQDDAKVYSFGMDVLKKFSEGTGDYGKVQFKLRNDTDDYYVQAKLTDGVYFVTGHTANKADGTVFTPGSKGHILVKGLEDDTYKLTEIHTASGYLLLREDVTIEIAADSTAKVNGTAVTMTGTGALVPLTVVNNKGFELPKTGGYGTWMFTAGGVLLLSAAAFTMVKAKKRK